ncbi:hypothetical protein [Spirosoma radiotolerans]|uniref:Uncharacterized protein n=1 Tax=Spirosoma radiotolerans TaxID=1379870 RepID=A0A0E3ZRR2_9BACT|nr:hypothetical protein [Spirosoma radiotolerans]AKD53794.1 hypothetical protein SD10_01630 [Spirosoma radiotolerans]
MKYKNITVRNLSKLDEEFNLSAEFNVSVDEKEKKYLSALGSKYKGQKTRSFHEVAELSKPRVIERGALCYQSSPNGLINLYIAKENKENKGGIQIITLKDSRITASYLVWYISQTYVQEYLSLFALGAVFSYIPISAFNKLIIPIPKSQLLNVVNESVDEVRISINNNPLRHLISLYYQEFTENFKRGNYMSAAIMAGAVGESIVYMYLLEKEVPESLLQRKTFGNLLEFIQIMKSEETEGFPLNHFMELQKLRNKAVHPGIAKDNVQPEAELEKPDFACLDNIVRYFGL